jgi:hypothetical protein
MNIACAAVLLACSVLLACLAVSPDRPFWQPGTTLRFVWGFIAGTHFLTALLILSR